MTKYKKPKVYRKITKSGQELWNYLEDSLDSHAGNPFYLDQSKLADELGYSRRTIRRRLEELERVGLLNKTQSTTGRGNSCMYQLNWTFYPKWASPSHYPKRLKALLRKGSSTWNWVAKNFREMVESATDTAKNVSVIVGKCLAIVANRHIEFARSLFRYTRAFLHQESATWQFYEWLRGHFIPVHQGEMTMHLDEQRHQRHMQEKAEAKQSWQQTDMPSVQDFDSFRQYEEAFAEWEKKQKIAGGGENRGPS